MLCAPARGAAGGQEEAGALIPIKDDIASRIKPVVMLVLIGANAAVWLYEVNLGGWDLMQMYFTWGASSPGCSWCTSSASGARSASAKTGPRGLVRATSCGPAGARAGTAGSATFGRNRMARRVGLPRTPHGP